MRPRLIFVLAFICQILFLNIAFAASPTGYVGLSSPVDPGKGVCTSPQGTRTHPVTGKERYHAGMDIGLNYGDSIRAIADGTVQTTSYEAGGYGYYIIINHGNGLISTYGHLQEILVSEGEHVSRGALIGLAGSSGVSTGPHLHLEIKINGEIKNPAAYIPELYQMQMEAGYDDPMKDVTATFEAIADFAKPLRELVELFVEASTKGLKLVKTMVSSIFMILLTIDLTIGLAWRGWGDEQDGSLLQWVIQRIVMYGFMMFILSGWGSVIAELGINSFPAFGAQMAGGSIEDAAKRLSDPTDIIQKGIMIIAPIINDALQIKGIWDYLTLEATQVLCFLFGVIFFILFVIMGIQIAIAYVQFYVTVLMGFTGFMLSGAKYTRKFGSNALNGVFVASINLMFFCVFSFMLTTTMENLAVADIVTHEVTAAQGGSGVVGRPGQEGTIKSLDELMVKMRDVESYGGQYHCDNGLGYYGAYQINKGYWDGWCNDYMEAHPNGPYLDTDETYKRYDGPPGPYQTRAEPTSTSWPWSPRNQDLVASYKLQTYHDEHGSWEAAARAWNGGNSREGMESAEAYEYQGMILSARGKSSIKTLVDLKLLFKLLIICLVFIFMADRMSKHFMRQFGQPGFKLSNELQ